ncbi:MAG: hypothetical protein K2P81_04900 [Bacteriovoracaceae bacterium]|nr:hypothetical protein [Bacteriovoracaceae bacterium]
MDKTLHIQQAEMNSLIFNTLFETVTDLGKKVDSMRLLSPMSMTDGAVIGLIDDTRKFVVFLKYANEYMQKTIGRSSIQEEMLRIKLHLLSVLRALSDYVKLNDKLAIHDLITEELRDNLTMWKINVIPLLRIQRNDHLSGLNPL